jgi:hypothetical protein
MAASMPSADARCCGVNYIERLPPVARTALIRSRRLSFTQSHRKFATAGATFDLAEEEEIDAETRDCLAHYFRRDHSPAE